MATTATHHSPLAGAWYPGDAAALRTLLEKALDASVRRTGPYVRPGGIAFIAPHAAPAYSGTVAASVYRHIAASGATRVILLGFSHRQSLRGIAIPDAAAIETPLGSIAVDRRSADTLAATPPFHTAPVEAACDHSVEIQIPFLQLLSPGASIVPLYIGRLDDDQRRAAARALRQCLDGRTVFVASSDLTHYGRDFGFQPFDAEAAQSHGLRTLDLGALDAAGSLDPVVFRAELQRTRATVCGAAPIELLLETLGGLATDLYQDTLDYQTSGEITGDFKHSVSYGAAGCFPAEAFWLDESCRAALLERTRATLDYYRSTGSEPVAADPPAELTQRGRAFVSLYASASLRGCVGRFEESAELARVVPRLARSAFEDDHRFQPVERDESTELEVHVLTPPKRIADPSRFEPGVHGGYLKVGSRRGLLLPVVAERYGLSRGTFLRQLARKAGVDDDIYSRDGWELSLFRAQVFREGGASA